MIFSILPVPACWYQLTRAAGLCTGRPPLDSVGDQLQQVGDLEGHRVPAAVVADADGGALHRAVPEVAGDHPVHRAAGGDDLDAAAGERADGVDGDHGLLLRSCSYLVIQAYPGPATVYSPSTRFFKVTAITPRGRPSGRPPWGYLSGELEALAGHEALQVGVVVVLQVLPEVTLQLRLRVDLGGDGVRVAADVAATGVAAGARVVPPLAAGLVGHPLADRSGQGLDGRLEPLQDVREGVHLRGGNERGEGDRAVPAALDVLVHRRPGGVGDGRQRGEAVRAVAALGVHVVVQLRGGVALGVLVLDDLRLDHLGGQLDLAGGLDDGQLLAGLGDGLSLLRGLHGGGLLQAGDQHRDDLVQRDLVREDVRLRGADDPPAVGGSVGEAVVAVRQGGDVDLVLLADDDAGLEGDGLAGLQVLDLGHFLLLRVWVPVPVPACWYYCTLAARVCTAWPPRFFSDRGGGRSRPTPGWPSRPSTRRCSWSPDPACGPQWQGGSSTRCRHRRPPTIRRCR